MSSPAVPSGGFSQVGSSCQATNPRPDGAPQGTFLPGAHRPLGREDELLPIPRGSQTWEEGLPQQRLLLRPWRWPACSPLARPGPCRGSWEKGLQTARVLWKSPGARATEHQPRPPPHPHPTYPVEPNPVPGAAGEFWSGDVADCGILLSTPGAHRAEHNQGLHLQELHLQEQSRPPKMRKAMEPPSPERGRALFLPPRRRPLGTQPTSHLGPAARLRGPPCKTGGGAPGQHNKLGFNLSFSLLTGLLRISSAPLSVICFGTATPLPAQRPVRRSTSLSQALPPARVSPSPAQSSRSGGTSPPALPLGKGSPSVPPGIALTRLRPSFRAGGFLLRWVTSG